MTAGAVAQTPERHIHRQPTGGAPHGRGHQGSGDEPETEPELQLEQVVERIARLVLHANTLADRMAAVPAGTAQVQNARDVRVQRLRAVVRLGQRAIQAAVWHGLDRRGDESRTVDHKLPGSTLR